MNKEKQPQTSELRDFRTYTWRKDWIRPYESLYSAFRTFSKVNALPYSISMKLISDGRSRGFSPDRLTNLKELSCSRPSRNFHPFRAEEYVIQFFLSDTETDSFPNLNNKAIEILLSSEHRYCPECIKIGYHSWLYQYRPLRECPIHKIPLEEGPFINDQWADDIAYHPALQKIDTDPLKEYYEKNFDQIKTLKLFTTEDNQDGSVLVKSLSTSKISEIGDEIYSRKIDDEPEVKKLISKYFRTTWRKLYKNDPNVDLAEADYIIKAGFPETHLPDPENPLFSNTRVPLLQIYTTIMDLMFYNIDESEMIKELLERYQMAVIRRESSFQSSLRLISRLCTGLYDKLRITPAYVDLFLEQRQDSLPWEHLNESDWELVCIDDHIRYHWNELKKMAMEESWLQQENLSWRCKKDRIWNLLDRLHNLWYLMVEDSSGILHVYRYDESGKKSASK